MLTYMQQLKEIAVANPRLAVALAQAKPQLPQVRTLTVTFTSGAPEQPVSAQLDQPITEDFWVYEISHVVSQPAAYKGSVLRGQQVYYNSLISDIYCGQLGVYGGVGLPWLFSPSPTPIELISSPTTAPGRSKYGCCSNFVMFFPQTVKGTFWLGRQYDDSPNGVGEIPIILTMAFTGVTLGCQNYGGLTVEQARAILRSEYSVDTPAVDPKLMSGQPPGR